MSINLQEIRTAVQTYLDTKVSVTISALTPAVGATIGPNEEFKFSITVANAIPLSGGVSLRNVRHFVHIDNANVGKLIVPPAPMVARSGSTTLSPVLTAGSLVSEMYLFPNSDDAGNFLSAGDIDAISLKGKAGSAPTGGNTSIRYKIFADVDQSFLFPASQDSATTTKALSVVG